MTRSLKRFLKANIFPWSTFKTYIKSSSKSELIVDLLFPFIISIILVYSTSLYVSDFKGVVERIKELCGQIVAAISILAGFNITSITIISTLHGPTNKLRNTSSLTNPSLSMYEVLISFFTWAVIIQLTVVLVGIILFYVGSFVTDLLIGKVPLWAWLFSSLILTIALHSIFISIRNMKTLYLYVTYEDSAGKKN